MVKVALAEGSSVVEIEVEIAGLRQRHQELEGEIAELDRHLSLSPDEQMKRARLKKEKLRIKDRILALSSEGAPPGAGPANHPALTSR